MLRRPPRATRTDTPFPDTTRVRSASGRGTLYTYTVMHHAYTPTMKGKTPYVVAVIRLDEGPYFHSNLIDCTLDQVRIGMQLQSAMIEQDNGLVVPVFRPTFESRETTA